MVLFAVRCNLALVTNWPPTAADRALLREVEALGQTVTRRQLKRWRQERLVPPPEQPGAGRGKGRPSLHYPQGTAQVVAKVAQVVGDGYSFHEAALALFLADLPVPEGLVRQALLDALDIAPAVQREPDPDQRIELVSRLVPVVKRLARRHPVMRHLSRRSHGQVLLGPEGQKYRGRPPEVMNDFLHSVISPLLLGEANIDGRAALAHVLDLNESEVPTLEARLKTLTIDGLQEAARHMPVARLCRGVEATKALFGDSSSPAPERPNYVAAALIALCLAVLTEPPLNRK